MRRIYILVSTILILIVVVYLFFIGQIKHSLIEFQKDLLFKQTVLCGNYVDKTVKEYENDLNRIIFNNINVINTIFEDKKVMHNVNQELESFYAKYRTLISSISVYNNKNNYLGIYINEDDQFVVDTFRRQQPNSLEERDVIKEVRDGYLNYFPYFKNDTLKGNIVVEINLKKYLDYVFNLFHIDEILFQWVINENEEIVYSNFSEEFTVQGINGLADSISNDIYGVIDHEMICEKNHRRIISSYYPLNIIKNDLGIVFSMNTAELLNIFINRGFLLTLISFLVILAILFFLIKELLRSKTKEKQLNSELISLSIIIEQFPIGIMILNKHGIIRNINRKAQKMLFVEKDEQIIGKNFEDQFLLSNKYLLHEEGKLPFDKNHFLHYEKDGNEIVIYRKDRVIHVAGEELTVSALIDVSPFEKSRKQEAAANSAKSDFLAKMSHEIRTPMNGIIGMTDNLLNSNLNKKDMEQAKMLKKSANLLLTIMNDILDFSKIEAGKMMLEEIPFSLSEEINLSIELFRKQAEENGVKITTEIQPEVPDKLIGDPFRLRQVISNLVSNSVKFTSKGEIHIGVKLMDKFNTSLSLLFFVEDTGIGIPKDKIKKIFASYEQAGDSTSRKYGGTGLGTSIAQQLVEMMNGEIWVESPCKLSDDPEFPGSKFSFTIEVYSDEKISKRFDYSHITDFNQITALILTKSKENDNLHRVLDSFGINYVYREYDDKAIDSVIYHIEKKRNLYQMIVIKDKERFEGFGIAQQLKENKITDNFPVVMISSNDQQGNYLKSKNLGVDHYLIKPYDSNEVYSFIKETFTGIKEIQKVTPGLNRIKSNLKILVADDNIINQRVGQTLFKHLGYEIDVAKNGKEAIDMQIENNYDIIFMDIMMPVIDGLAATKEIRKKSPKTPIIAMTGNDGKEHRDEAFSCGMNDFLTKPVKTESVKRLLIKWFSESL